MNTKSLYHTDGSNSVSTMGTVSTKTGGMPLLNARCNIKNCIVAFSLVFFFSSCLDDLNTLPLNDHELTSDKVFNSSEGYRGLLAKCYGVLVMSGQSFGGNSDVAGIDEGYSSYTRSLLYLQDAASDIILFHSGSGVGTRDILFTNWHSGTQVIMFSYYRLMIAIAFSNELLREITDAKLRERNLYNEMQAEAPYYRAEARFIRAYAYSVLLDVYGSVPFIDENSRLGDIPRQRTREQLYDYTVAELEALATELKAPGTNEYGRVDRVAAWFLLARTYLNAEVYVGKNEYAKAYENAKKVIESGAYPLASDYRHVFLADNRTCGELVWPMPQDLENTKSWGGSNFVIKAMTAGTMREYTGMSDTWGNARMKTQLVDMFHADDQPFDENDPWGDNKMDKRAQFFTINHTKETWTDGPLANDFRTGYATLKWRNMTKDRQPLEPGGTTYSAIDYPMFRTADAYLMAAEAILRGGGGTRAEALGYVNRIRDRAYMFGDFAAQGIRSVDGRITDAELTLDFILDERARELHLELVRRTDLIRFGKFTKSNNWDWKGSDGAAGNHIGKDVDDKYKLFPIPQSDITANPFLVQNSDF